MNLNHARQSALLVLGQAEISTGMRAFQSNVYLALFTLLAIYAQLMVYVSLFRGSGETATLWLGASSGFLAMAYHELNRKLGVR